MRLLVRFLPSSVLTSPFGSKPGWRSYKSDNFKNGIPIASSLAKGMNQSSSIPQKVFPR